MQPPPRAKGVVPYSGKDLDSLFATTHSVPLPAMITLNPPPTARIITWPGLLRCLQWLKTLFTNLHRRHNLPALVLATEFDPVLIGGLPAICANFHAGLTAPLPESLRDTVMDQWLEFHSLPDNQGRAFQQDVDDGRPGGGFQYYVGKFEKKGRWTKDPPVWVPERTEIRLWFTVGVGKCAALEGSKLRAMMGIRMPSRPKRQSIKTDSAQETFGKGGLIARRRDLADGEGPEGDSAQDVVRVTCDHDLQVSINGNQCRPVPVDAVQPVHADIVSGNRIYCGTCWNRWGRSLWVGECICNGRVELKRRCPTLSTSPASG